MCKSFAFGYECSWQSRGRLCKLVHSQTVKNAYDLYVKCIKDKTKFTTKMRDECLDPEKKMDEKGLYAQITLFMKYPQAPKGQELARMEE